MTLGLAWCLLILVTLGVAALILVDDNNPDE